MRRYKLTRGNKISKHKHYLAYIYIYISNPKRQRAFHFCCILFRFIVIYFCLLCNSFSIYILFHFKNCEFFPPSQKCGAESLSVCPTPECIRTRENDHVRKLKILYSISEIGGLWKHQKDPACTLRTEG